MKHGEYKMPGGKLVVVDLDVRAGQLMNVQVSGDFFLEPDSALQTINATLEGLPAGIDSQAISAMLDQALGREVSMYGVSSESIATAVRRALESDA